MIIIKDREGSQRWSLEAHTLAQKSTNLYKGGSIFDESTGYLKAVRGILI